MPSRTRRLAVVQQAARVFDSFMEPVYDNVRGRVITHTARPDSSGSQTPLRSVLLAPAVPRHAAQQAQRVRNTFPTPGRVRGRVITYTAHPDSSGSQTPLRSVLLAPAVLHSGLYTPAVLHSGTRTPAVPAAGTDFSTPVRVLRPTQPGAPPRTGSDTDLRVANPVTRAFRRVGAASSSLVQSVQREIQRDDEQSALAVRQGVGLATPCRSGVKRASGPAAPQRDGKRRRSRPPIDPVNLDTGLECVNQRLQIAQQQQTNGLFADYARTAMNRLRGLVRTLEVAPTPEFTASLAEVTHGVVQARILDGNLSCALQMKRLLDNVLQFLDQCQAAAGNIIGQQRHTVDMVVASTRVMSSPSLVALIASFIPIYERLRVVRAIASIVRLSVDAIHPRLRSQITAELWRLECRDHRLQALFRELETYRDFRDPEEEGTSIVAIKAPDCADVVEFISTLQEHIASPVELDLDPRLKHTARRVLRLVVLDAIKEQYKVTSRAELGHRRSIPTAPVYARVLADPDVQFFWRRPHYFVKREITEILYELVNDEWAWYNWGARFDMVKAWLVVPCFGGESEVDLD